jgi:hypothetical protein
VKRLAAALAVIAVGVGVGAAPASAQPLTVMTFNVWYGGVQVDFSRIGAAIRRADADIVGVQEPEGNLRAIARSAGLPYVDESLHLISRYPLYAAQRGGIRFAYAALRTREVVAIANTHLPLQSLRTRAAARRQVAQGGAGERAPDAPERDQALPGPAVELVGRRDPDVPDRGLQLAVAPG